MLPQAMICSRTGSTIESSDNSGSHGATLSRSLLYYCVIAHRVSEDQLSCPALEFVLKSLESEFVVYEARWLGYKITPCLFTQTGLRVPSETVDGFE